MSVLIPKVLDPRAAYVGEGIAFAFSTKAKRPVGRIGDKRVREYWLSEPLR
jgi:hypothetical protein